MNRVPANCAPSGTANNLELTDQMPRLSHFIREHDEEILAAWEAFARELSGGVPMNVPALRDHAHAMLNVIAADLETPESDEHRERKSRGMHDKKPEEVMTAASRHGRGRAEHGFSVESMVAEFRALRASVISLWVEHQKAAEHAGLEEMRRFNEAIDQALAESLSQYAHDVESARDRFLAVLGHDLRTPLTAILMSSRFLIEEGHLSENQHRLIAGMEHSARRMTQLVADLLDVALTRFGDTIPLRRVNLDLGVLVRDAGAEVNAATPTALVNIETSGQLVGEWDRTRLEQALINLVNNAIEHGSLDKAINVTASGDGDGNVTISVSNRGTTIPRDRIGGLFAPMKGSGGDRDSRQHLGLGLYIVNRIVQSHGGRIDVRSSDEGGTTFRITLPRHGPPDHEEPPPGSPHTL